MTAPLFNPDEFCRTCRGNKGFREDTANGYIWTPCDTCAGTGWRGGARIDPAPDAWKPVGDLAKKLVEAQDRAPTSHHIAPEAQP